jgi:iron complex outermembrane receptor protein
MLNALKRQPAFLLLLPAGLSIGMQTKAQTLDSHSAVNLPPVNVQVLPVDGSQTVTQQDTPATTYVVGPQTTGLLDSGGSANPFRAISILPSVNAPAIDPFGLANIPGSNKGITVRGEQPQHGASNITVDGVPLTGIDPGPGSQWLFANENIKAIELIEGPIPPDRAIKMSIASSISLQPVARFSLRGLSLVGLVGMAMPAALTLGRYPRSLINIGFWRGAGLLLGGN